MNIRVGSMICAPVALLLAVGSLRSGDEKDLRAIITKAIQAKGGDGNAKFQGISMKANGNFYGLGDPVPFTGEWHFQGHKQSRFELEMKIANQPLRYVQIINGDKGWIKINDEAKAMSAEEVAEEKEDMYAKWVSTVSPLKDKAFKLAGLGEVKIGDKTATGVRVSHQGRRDINLFFDKTTGLLVKTESMVKDVKGGANKEMSQEVLTGEYKEFKGIKFPTKITINHDGKQHVEADMSDIRFVEMIDDALFAQP